MTTVGIVFERELAFFIAHQDELVASHRGRFLVLRDEKVEGVYATALQAYTDAKKKFEQGSFMIQPCEPGSDAYTVSISSSSW